MSQPTSPRGHSPAFPRTSAGAKKIEFTDWRQAFTVSDIEAIRAGITVPWKEAGITSETIFYHGTTLNHVKSICDGPKAGVSGGTAGSGGIYAARNFKYSDAYARGKHRGDSRTGVVMQGKANLAPGREYRVAKITLVHPEEVDLAKGLFPYGWYLSRDLQDLLNEFEFVDVNFAPVQYVVWEPFWVVNEHAGADIIRWTSGVSTVEGRRTFGFWRLPEGGVRYVEFTPNTQRLVKRIPTTRSPGADSLRGRVAARRPAMPHFERSTSPQSLTTPFVFDEAQFPFSMYGGMYAFSEDELRIANHILSKMFAANNPVLGNLILRHIYGRLQTGKLIVLFYNTPNVYSGTPGCWFYEKLPNGDLRHCIQISLTNWNPPPLRLVRHEFSHDFVAALTNSKIYASFIPHPEGVVDRTEYIKLVRVVQADIRHCLRSWNSFTPAQKAMYREIISKPSRYPYHKLIREAPGTSRGDYRDYLKVYRSAERAAFFLQGALEDPVTLRSIAPNLVAYVDDRFHRAGLLAEGQSVCPVPGISSRSADESFRRLGIEDAREPVPVARVRQVPVQKTASSSTGAATTPSSSKPVHFLDHQLDLDVLGVSAGASAQQPRSTPISAAISGAQPIPAPERGLIPIGRTPAPAGGGALIPIGRPVVDAEVLPFGRLGPRLVTNFTGQPPDIHPGMPRGWKPVFPHLPPNRIPPSPNRICTMFLIDVALNAVLQGDYNKGFDAALCGGLQFYPMAVIFGMGPAAGIPFLAAAYSGPQLSQTERVDLATEALNTVSKREEAMREYQQGKSSFWQCWATFAAADEADERIGDAFLGDAYRGMAGPVLNAPAQILGAAAEALMGAPIYDPERTLAGLAIGAVQKHLASFAPTFGSPYSPTVPPSTPPHTTPQPLGSPLAAVGATAVALRLLGATQRPLGAAQRPRGLDLFSIPPPPKLPDHGNLFEQLMRHMQAHSATTPFDMSAPDGSRASTSYLFGKGAGIFCMATGSGAMIVGIKIPLGPGAWAAIMSIPAPVWIAGAAAALVFMGIRYIFICRKNLKLENKLRLYNAHKTAHEKMQAVDLRLAELHKTLEKKDVPPSELLSQLATAHSSILAALQSKDALAERLREQKRPNQHAECLKERGVLAQQAEQIKQQQLSTTQQVRAEEWLKDFADSSLSEIHEALKPLLAKDIITDGDFVRISGLRDLFFKKLDSSSDEEARKILGELKDTRIGSLLALVKYEAPVLPCREVFFVGGKQRKQKEKQKEMHSKAEHLVAVMVKTSNAVSEALEKGESREEILAKVTAALNAVADYERMFFKLDGIEKYNTLNDFLVDEGFDSKVIKKDLERLKEKAEAAPSGADKQAFVSIFHNSQVKIINENSEILNDEESSIEAKSKAIAEIRKAQSFLRELGTADASLDQKLTALELALHGLEQTPAARTLESVRLAQKLAEAKDEEAKIKIQREIDIQNALDKIVDATLEGNTDKQYKAQKELLALNPTEEDLKNCAQIVAQLQESVAAHEKIDDLNKKIDEMGKNSGIIADKHASAADKEAAFAANEKLRTELSTKVTDKDIPNIERFKQALERDALADKINLAGNAALLADTRKAAELARGVDATDAAECARLRAEMKESPTATAAEKVDATTKIAEIKAREVERLAAFNADQELLAQAFITAANTLATEEQRAAATAQITEIKEREAQRKTNSDKDKKEFDAAVAVCGDPELRKQLETLEASSKKESGPLVEQFYATHYRPISDAAVRCAQFLLTNISSTWGSRRTQEIVSRVSAAAAALPLADVGVLAMMYRHGDFSTAAEAVQEFWQRTKAHNNPYTSGSTLNRQHDLQIASTAFNIAAQMAAHCDSPFAKPVAQVADAVSTASNAALMRAAAQRAWVASGTPGGVAPEDVMTLTSAVTDAVIGALGALSMPPPPSAPKGASALVRVQTSVTRAVVTRVQALGWRVFNPRNFENEKASHAFDIAAVALPLVLSAVAALFRKPFSAGTVRGRSLLSLAALPLLRIVWNLGWGGRNSYLQRMSSCLSTYQIEAQNSDTPENKQELLSRAEEVFVKLESDLFSYTDRASFITRMTYSPRNTNMWTAWQHLFILRECERAFQRKPSDCKDVLSLTELEKVGGEFVLKLFRHPARDCTDILMQRLQALANTGDFAESLELTTVVTKNGQPHFNKLHVAAAHAPFVFSLRANALCQKLQHTAQEVLTGISSAESFTKDKLVAVRDEINKIYDEFQKVCDQLSKLQAFKQEKPEDYKKISEQLFEMAVSLRALHANCMWKIATCSSDHAKVVSEHFKQCSFARSATPAVAEALGEADEHVDARANLAICVSHYYAGEDAEALSHYKKAEPLAEMGYSTEYELLGFMLKQTRTDLVTRVVIFVGFVVLGGGSLTSEALHLVSEAAKTIEAAKTMPPQTRGAGAVVAAGWKSLKTPGFGNNCGIYATHPLLAERYLRGEFEQAHKEAQAIRMRLHTELLKMERAGQFTARDVESMRHNLPADARQEGSNNAEVIRVYLDNILHGGFLDHAALARIAQSEGKFLIVIQQSSLAVAQQATLAGYLDYYLTMHHRGKHSLPPGFTAEPTLANTVFVYAHDSETHFEGVAEIPIPREDDVAITPTAPKVPAVPSAESKVTEAASSLHADANDLLSSSLGLFKNSGLSGIVGAGIAASVVAGAAPLTVLGGAAVVVFGGALTGVKAWESALGMMSGAVGLIGGAASLGLKTAAVASDACDVASKAYYGSAPAPQPAPRPTSRAAAARS